MRAHFSLAQEKSGSVDETLSNLIKEQTLERGKGGKTGRSTFYQETFPKSANAPTGVAKESDEDPPKQVKITT